MASFRTSSVLSGFHVEYTDLGRLQRPHILKTILLQPLSPGVGLVRMIIAILCNLPVRP